MLDPRIKTLKCTGCKIEIDARVRENVDLCLTTCNLNDPNVAKRLGPCPLKQVVTMLDRMEAKKRGEPKKMEIPRLLDMTKLPPPANHPDAKVKRHPYETQNCLDAGECCHHGQCMGCLDGNTDPRGPIILAQEVIDAIKANAIKKGPRLVSIDKEKRECEIECDDVVVMTLDRRGNMTVGHAK